MNNKDMGIETDRPFDDTRITVDDKPSPVIVYVFIGFLLVLVAIVIAVADKVGA